MEKGKENSLKKVVYKVEEDIGRAHGGDEVIPESLLKRRSTRTPSSSAYTPSLRLQIHP